MWRTEILVSIIKCSIYCGLCIIIVYFTSATFSPKAFRNTKQVVLVDWLNTYAGCPIKKKGAAGHNNLSEYF